MAGADSDIETVQSDGRPAAKAALFDAALAAAWRGFVSGDAIGGSITVLTYATDPVGEGPRLHLNGYDETFIVIEGEARFFVGDADFNLRPGDVVLGPGACRTGSRTSVPAGCRPSISTPRPAGFRRTSPRSAYQQQNPPSTRRSTPVQ
jgi:hypothetical protein